MLNDYEEDDIFAQQLVGTTTGDNTNRSWTDDLTSFVFPSLEFNSLPLVDCDIDRHETVDVNRKLLAFLCELVRAIFEAETEIQTFLNQQNQFSKSLTNHPKSNRSSDTAIDCLTDCSSDHEHHTSTAGSDSECSSSGAFSFGRNRSDSGHCGSNEDPDDKESPLSFAVSPDALPSISRHNSRVVDSHNYYEISCSYIVQLNNNTSGQVNPREIVEDKKNYISASINVNNWKSTGSIGEPSNGETDESIQSDQCSNTQSDQMSFRSFQVPSSDDEEEVDCRGPVESSSGHSENPLSMCRFPSTDPPESPLVTFTLKRKASNSTIAGHQSPIGHMHGDSIKLVELSELSTITDDNLVSIANRRLKRVIRRVLNAMQSLSDCESTLIEQIERYNCELQRTSFDDRTEANDLQQKLDDAMGCFRQLCNDLSDLRQRHGQMCTFQSELKQIQWQITVQQEQIVRLSNSIAWIKLDAHHIAACERLPARIELIDNLLEHETEEEQVLFVRSDMLQQFQQKVLRNSRPLPDEITGDAVCPADGEGGCSHMKVDDPFAVQSHWIEPNFMAEKCNLLDRIAQLEQQVEQLVSNTASLSAQKRTEEEDYRMHLSCVRRRLQADRKFVNEQMMEREAEKDDFERQLALLRDRMRQVDQSIVKKQEDHEHMRFDLETVDQDRAELGNRLQQLRAKFEQVDRKRSDLSAQVDRQQAEAMQRNETLQQLGRRCADLQRMLRNRQADCERSRAHNHLSMYDRFEQFLDELVRRIRLHEQTDCKAALPQSDKRFRLKSIDCGRPMKSRTTVHVPESGRKGNLIRKSKSFLHSSGSSSSPSWSIAAIDQDEQVNAHSTPKKARPATSFTERRSFSSDCANDFFVDFYADDDILISKCDIYMYSNERLNSVVTCSSLSDLVEDVAAPSGAPPSVTGSDDTGYKSGSIEEPNRSFDAKSDVWPTRLQLQRSTSPSCPHSNDSLNETSPSLFSSSSSSSNDNVERQASLIDWRKQSNAIQATLDGRQERLLHKMRSDSSTIDQFLDKMATERSELHDRLNRTLKYNRDMDAKVELRRLENESLGQQLKSELSAANDLQTQLNDQHLKLSELKSQFATGCWSQKVQNETLRELGSFVHVQQDRAQHVQRQLVAYDEMVRSKNDELADCRDQFEYTRQCVTTMKAQNVSLINSNRDLREQNQKLKQQIDRLRLQQLLHSYQSGRSIPLQS